MNCRADEICSSDQDRPSVGGGFLTTAQFPDWLARRVSVSRRGGAPPPPRRRAAALHCCRTRDECGGTADGLLPIVEKDRFATMVRDKALPPAHGRLLGSGLIEPGHILRDRRRTSRAVARCRRRARRAVKYRRTDRPVAARSGCIWRQRGLVPGIGDSWLVESDGRSNRLLVHRTVDSRKYVHR